MWEREYSENSIDGYFSKWTHSQKWTLVNFLATHAYYNKLKIMDSLNSDNGHCRPPPKL